MGIKHGWRLLIAAAAISGGGFASNAEGAGDVVVSQVWGGGDSAGSGPNADYVELFNRTSNPIDMSAWSLQVALPTGTSWQKLDLAATIQPFSYYLVQVSWTAGGVAPNYLADAAFNPTTNSLQANGGKVALLSNQTVLPDDATCHAGDSAIIDFVGFGFTPGGSPVSCREGSAAPGSTSGSTPIRNGNGCVDTNNNAADFALASPNPRNSGSAHPPSCDPTGACCDPLTAACTIDTSLSCVTAGRSYAGNGVLCSPSPCAAIGRCCTALPGLCYVTTLAGCNTVNSGQWAPGLTCSSAPVVCGFTDYPITTTACCFGDGTCCQIDARVRSCSSMGGTAPGGPACQPLGAGFACGNTPPANDLCAGAIPLALTIARFGSNAPALNNDLCQNLCNNVSFSTHGVWFTFTPAASAQYDVATCGSLFQTELQILQIGSCTLPSTWSYVACSYEEGCTAGFPETGPCGQPGFSFNAKLRGVHLSAGQTYHVLLTGPGPSGGVGGQSGNYKLLVSMSAPAPFGACCSTITGQCELRSQAGCASSLPSAIYQGDSSACSPTLCGLDVGACCIAGGCTLRTADFCSTRAGNFIGGTCLPSPCVTGACCSRVGSCLAATQMSQCIVNSGTYLGDNATCSGVSCPQPGACCYPSGLCELQTETACVSPYPVFGTIGVFQGVAVACAAAGCPQPGRCCDPSTTCTLVLQSLCPSGSAWTSGGSCTPNPCASGVCCRGATCNISVAQVDCLGSGTAGASYSITSTTCNTSGSAATPCCYADFNKVGGISVQDIFDYLSAWFGGSAFALVGGDGAIGSLAVQNIFDFLAAWFAGGC